MAASSRLSPDGGRARHGESRAQIVIGSFAVRHHHIQAIGRAALENGDQDLLARVGSVGGIERALSHSGAAPAPTMAKAELRRKTRRSS